VEGSVHFSFLYYGHYQMFFYNELSVIEV
jgi:hypothetical protein